MYNTIVSIPNRTNKKSIKQKLLSVRRYINKEFENNKKTIILVKDEKVAHIDDIPAEAFKAKIKNTLAHSINIIY